MPIRQMTGRRTWLINQIGKCRDLLKDRTLSRDNRILVEVLLREFETDIETLTIRKDDDYEHACC